MEVSPHKWLHCWGSTDTHLSALSFVKHLFLWMQYNFLFLQAQKPVVEKSLHSMHQVMTTIKTVASTFSWDKTCLNNHDFHFAPLEYAQKHNPKLLYIFCTSALQWPLFKYPTSILKAGLSFNHVQPSHDSRPGEECPPVCICHVCVLCPRTSWA